jgi:hypothetical protein
MARWNATNALWGLKGDSVVPRPLAEAPAGALLALPDASGASLVAVAGDALWLMGSGAPPVRVAGPLYSVADPSGYYGEVDWAGTFAWSSGTGVRQGSTELLGQDLDGAGGVTP